MPSARAISTRFVSFTSGTLPGCRFGCPGAAAIRRSSPTALQDTFVAVWQKPAAFRGQGEVAGWLWGIAIRRLVSRLRSRRDVIVGFERAEAAPVPAAEEQVLLSVEYGDVGQALAQLSPQLRAVIQAVVLDGLTTREAARLLHMPEGSVKTRLSRAKVQLRAALVEGVQ